MTHLDIDPKELRKALTELMLAELRGFKYCLVRFDSQGNFKDIWTRAHPSNPHLDWGVEQNVYKRFKFIDGLLQKGD